MVIKSTSLEDLELSKFENEPETVKYHFFRYRETWSNGDEFKYILTEPKLSDYYHYPELLLVDSNYCVNL